MPVRPDDEFDNVLSNILRHEKLPVSSLNPTPKTKPAKKRRSRRLHAFKVRYALIPLLLVLVGAGIYIARGPISEFLAPPSPFVGKVKGSSYPPYYPTRLPEGFKIELESISQPEGESAIVYSLSNEVGQKVFISLQAKPEGLDQSKLEALLTETRDVETKYGRFKVGKSDIDTEMGNIITDKTWIIVSSDPSLLSDEQFDGMLKSFRVGNI